MIKFDVETVTEEEIKRLKYKDKVIVYSSAEYPDQFRITWLAALIMQITSVMPVIELGEYSSGN